MTKTRDETAHYFVFSVMRAMAVTGDAQQFGPVPIPARATVDSFEAIYLAHEPDVRRFLIVIANRGPDIEDLVAETFARALSAHRAGRGPKGAPLPWLLLIARRLVVDRWRRQRLVAWLPFRRVSEPGGVEADLGRVEFWTWLGRLAEVLNERQRAALLLRYQADLSDEEIGRVLGVTGSGVRSLVARALEVLRGHPELWK